MQHEPHNFDVEQRILGSILINPTAVHVVYDQIGLNHNVFFVEAHQYIYMHCVFLMDRGTTIDIGVLAAELDRSDKLAVAGGATYLGELCDVDFSGVNVSEYCDILINAYQLRRMLDFSRDIRLQVETDNSDAHAIREQIETWTMQLSDIADVSRTTHVSVLADEVLGEAKRLLENPGITPGMATGIEPLDNLTGGLFGGEMTIVAARPGVGKTAIALNMALNLAKDGVPVHIISLEMSKLSLAKRMWSAFADVSLSEMRRGEVWEPTVKKLHNTKRMFAGLPIHVDDSGASNLTTILSRVRRMQAQHKVQAVFVDYLQLVKDPGNKHEKRYAEVGEISRQLKLLAKNANIAVVALAQIGREAEKDPEPKARHLRESGSLEQDADNILMLWNDENEEEIIHAKLEKQREGPRGKFDLRFQKYTQRITPLPQAPEPPGSSKPAQGELV